MTRKQKISRIFLNFLDIPPSIVSAFLVTLTCIYVYKTQELARNVLVQVETDGAYSTGTTMTGVEVQLLDPSVGDRVLSALPTGLTAMTLLVFAVSMLYTFRSQSSSGFTRVPTWLPLGSSVFGFFMLVSVLISHVFWGVHFSRFGQVVTTDVQVQCVILLSVSYAFHTVVTYNERGTKLDEKLDGVI